MKIIIDLGNEELEVTIEEAKKIYDELKDIFGDKTSPVLPANPNPPCNPYNPYNPYEHWYQPNDPYNPYIITCSLPTSNIIESNNCTSSRWLDEEVTIDKDQLEFNF